MTTPVRMKPELHHEKKKMSTICVWLMPHSRPAPSFSTGLAIDSKKYSAAGIRKMYLQSDTDAAAI